MGLRARNLGHCTRTCPDVPLAFGLLCCILGQACLRDADILPTLSVHVRSQPACNKECSIPFYRNRLTPKAKTIKLLFEGTC